MCSHCWNKLIAVSSRAGRCRGSDVRRCTSRCVYTERIARWISREDGIAGARRDRSRDRLHLGLRQVRELLQWTTRPTP